MKTEDLLRYERMRRALERLTGSDFLVIVNAVEAGGNRPQSRRVADQPATLPAPNSDRSRP